MYISIMGDISMRGQEQLTTVEQAEKILSHINPRLSHVDLRIANWENPTTKALTPIAKAGPPLHSKVENMCFLEAAKVGLAVLANNHTGDQGPDGVMETIGYLKQRGIGTVGAGKDVDDAYQPFRFEKGGETLDVFAVCEHEFGFATEDEPGTAAYEHFRLRRAIAGSSADHVLVVMHGGNEYCPIPSPMMVERCRDFVDAGASAVVVQHAHCMQGYEWYQGAPIVYSTGNFFFGFPSCGDRAKGWCWGYVPVFRFEKGQPAQMEIIPYQYDKCATEIRVFEGEKLEAILTYIEQLNRAIADRKLHQELFDGWSLHVGEMYSPGVVFREQYKQGDLIPAFYGFADVWRCEAHAEMLNRYYRILEKGWLDRTRPLVDKVLALSIVPVSLFEE